MSWRANLAECSIRRRWFAIEREGSGPDKEEKKLERDGCPPPFSDDWFDKTGFDWALQISSLGMVKSNWEFAEYRWVNTIQLLLMSSRCPSACRNSVGFLRPHEHPWVPHLFYFSLHTWCALPPIVVWMCVCLCTDCLLSNDKITCRCWSCHMMSGKYQPRARTEWYLEYEKKFSPGTWYRSMRLVGWRR